MVSKGEMWVFDSSIVELQLESITAMGDTVDVINVPIRASLAVETKGLLFL